MSGFLDRFRRAGLGDAVSSWLSGGSKPVSGENVESVLGRDTVNNLAARSGLSASTTASTLAFYVPRVVQRMAPGGVVPSTLPPDLAAYVTGPTSAIASGVYQTANRREVVRRRGVTGVLWPLWVIIAIIIIAIAFWRGAWGWGGNGRRAGAYNRGGYNNAGAVEQANRQSSAALAALQPGYSSQQLVNALNFQRINFGQNSAQIPNDAYQILKQSAEAIKTAPAGNQIKIAGFARSGGNNNESALQLSQDRADAVRQYFINRGVNGSMLVAKGYGDTNPTNLAVNEQPGANAGAENNPNAANNPGAENNRPRNNQAANDANQGAGSNNNANGPDNRDIEHIARH